MPGASLTKLEERRWHLVRFIERNRPQGSANNSVTVVFDGNSDAYGRMNSPVVRVIFSSGESADDTIKKIVAQEKNKKNVIVVTDDRDVQYAIRALGAKASSVKAFLSQGNGPGQTKPGKMSSDLTEKVISKSDESKITSEMKEIWLKPGKKRGG